MILIKINAQLKLFGSIQQVQVPDCIKNDSLTQAHFIICLYIPIFDKHVKIYLNVTLF